jgi:hypothetical protein
VRVRSVIDNSHDDDDIETDTYYGQIEEIWELDYVGLKVALFRCRWVTNGKRAVSKDKYGYVSVDLWVFGYKNESFVFANDVESTSPNSWEVTKHRTCEVTIVKKSIYINQGRKSKPDFC